VGCHENKQLDRVCRIPDKRASRQQIKCAKAKSAKTKSKALVGKLTGAFCFVYLHAGRAKTFLETSKNRATKEAT
jgi:hypothetical protein